MVFFRNDEEPDGETRQAGPATRVIPLLPLRDIVVFPHMVVPLFVGRAKSIQALEDAVSGGRELVLSAQRHASQDEPGEDDIYPMGTLGSIIQLLRLPDGTVKVLVEGKVSSLRESLAKVSGVASVEVNAEQKWVKITAQKDSLVPRRHLLAAAEKLDLNVTSYEVPQWAQQVVYDVGTTGGG